MSASVVRADDGLKAEVVGAWAEDKHAYLCRYLDASRGARRKFVGPGKPGATFADLFCAFGRSKIRNTPRFVDGSAVAAWKASAGNSAPFTRVYVADLERPRRDTCVTRLQSIGAPVTPLSGGAVAAAAEYCSLVNTYGLHLAFLDPHNLGALDFRIVEKLSELRHVDMLIHVSAMDMQRNLRSQLSDNDAAEFDTFAPGWRKKIPSGGPQSGQRRWLLEYWSERVRALGMLPFTSRLITGPGGQRLYWLMLASREKLAHALWQKIGRPDRQVELPF